VTSISVAVHDTPAYFLAERAGAADTEQTDAWRALASELLAAAYLDRPAGLVLVAHNEPRESLARELGFKRPERVAGGSCWFVPIAVCTSDVLTAIGAGWELPIGWAWVTSIQDRVDERVTALVHAVEASGYFERPPATDEEVFRLAGDERAIWWLNPARPTVPLRHLVSAAAVSRGWDVED
jgi:hypothetical protein